MNSSSCLLTFFFFQAEDGIRDLTVTGVQTCALPIWRPAAGSREPRVRRDPAAGRRPRSALQPVQAWAGRRPRNRSQLPGTTGMTRKGRLPTGPRAGGALDRVPDRSYGFDQGARQLAEGGQCSDAGFVIAGHDVVQAEAQDCVQHQRDQHLARHGEPDPAVSLEAVELLLDDLAVPGEELGQVGAEPLRPGRLYQEVERRELDVAQAPQRVPQRLDPDLEDLERVGELVEGRAQLLDRVGGEVAPSLDQELGLGRKPVLEVADGDAGPGGDGADAGSGVAVFEQRIGCCMDDLISGALGGGGPGHTYVLLYNRRFSGVYLPTRRARSGPPGARAAHHPARSLRPPRRARS